MTFVFIWFLIGLVCAIVYFISCILNEVIKISDIVLCLFLILLGILSAITILTISIQELIHNDIIIWKKKK